MRVLLVVHGFPPEGRGGTELQTASVARELARAGHKVFVFAGNRRLDGGAMQVRDRRDGDVRVRVVDVPIEADFALKLRDEAVGAEFERYVEATRPDVVHVQHLLYLGLDLIEAAKLRGLPVVVTLHDFWFQCPLIHPGPAERHPFPGALWGLACFKHYEVRSRAHALNLFGRRQIRKSIARHLERASVARRQLRLADVVIAPSQFVRRRFLRFGLSAENLLVLSHPVPPPRARAREATAPVTFAFVGSVAPAKGVHVLCNAFARTPGRSTLRIFGPAEDRGYVDGLASYPDSRIRYDGEFDRADLEDVFGRFDVLVVPSLVHESFSLVALEAQAHRRAVIASRVGAIPELVEHGTNGLLVPPGDTQSLAKAIARLQDVHEVRRLQAHARSTLSPAAHTRRLEEIYRRAASSAT